MFNSPRIENDKQTSSFSLSALFRLEPCLHVTTPAARLQSPCLHSSTSPHLRSTACSKLPYLSLHLQRASRPLYLHASTTLRLRPHIQRSRALELHSSTS